MAGAFPTKGAFALAVAAALTAADAHAYELHSGADGSMLGLDVELGVGYFSSQEDYSGLDREEVDWSEGYLKGGLSGQRMLGGGASLYGAVSVLASATDGDGDAGGFTTGDEGELDLEDAYVGWRSGSLVGGVEDAVDLSVGAQPFTVGDGWLINGDALSFGEGFGNRLDRGGAYWLAPRRAFRETAIARFDTVSPWRGDVFYLGSDNEAQGETKLAGLNMEYDEPWGSLGAAYLRVTEVDEDVLGGMYATRDGLNTFSLRGNSSLGIDGADLRFEATLQRGSPDTADVDVDAHAWYVEGSYRFAELPLAPQLAYRFSSFSGDDPGTSEYEGFDPLFYGFSRGYGTWFQGEVAGNYTGPFNTNADIHHLGLYLHPHERLRVGALYFDFTTRETPAGVSDDYAEELDLFMEYAVTERLFVSPVYSRFSPGRGLEQTLGSDDTNHYFQVIAIWSF